MSSVIAPEPRAICRICNGKVFKPKVYDVKLKLSIYVCASCGDYPNKNRLRRMLPIGVDGESVRVDIRFNRVGEKFESIEEAMHIARSIDYDLRDGRFDPNDYRPKGMTATFLFKNLIKDKYIPYCENKFGVGGFETKQVMINHLLKFFGDKDIRKIKSGDVKEFQLTYKCGARSKALAIQEFGVLFDFFKELEIVTQTLVIPKTTQSRERAAEEALTKDEQQIVLNYIYEDDDYYGKMIETLAIYTIRPGDLRGIKQKDINRLDMSFQIRDHFAKSKLKAGRKSTDKIHELPITERFLEILNSLPQSLNGDDFVFKSKLSNGQFTDGPVGEARMRIYWNKAMKKANRKHKIKIVTLYVGTKTTSLSSYLNDGVALEDLRHLPGLNSVKTLKRYALESKANKLKKVRNILSKESDRISEIG